MRDHSGRKYNKTKVTRFRSKSTFRADNPQKIARFKFSQPLPRPKKLWALPPRPPPPSANNLPAEWFSNWCLFLRSYIFTTDSRRFIADLSGYLSATSALNPWYPWLFIFSPLFWRPLRCSRNDARFHDTRCPAPIFLFLPMFAQFAQWHF